MQRSLAFYHSLSRYCAIFATAQNRPANFDRNGVMLDYIFIPHTNSRSRIHRCVRLAHGYTLNQESRKTAAFCPSYIALKSGGDEVSEELGDMGDGALSSGAMKLIFGVHFAP